MDVFALLSSILSGVTLLVVGGLSKRIATTFRGQREIEEAKNEIVKCSARRDILEAYERYIVRGEHMSITRYDEIEREYKAYKKLGGNGTAKAYMEEIEKKRPYLVTD